MHSSDGCEPTQDDSDHLTVVFGGVDVVAHSYRPGDYVCWCPSVMYRLLWDDRNFLASSFFPHLHGVVTASVDHQPSDCGHLVLDILVFCFVSHVLNCCDFLFYHYVDHGCSLWMDRKDRKVGMTQ